MTCIFPVSLNGGQFGLRFVTDVIESVHSPAPIIAKAGDTITSMKCDAVSQRLASLLNFPNAAGQTK